MKTKIEIFEFPLYEEAVLEEHLHKQAKKGWLLRSMSAWLAVYEKGQPQDRYYTIDYFSADSLLDLEKSQQGQAYLSFLETYGCTRVCGSGLRQIIQLPHEQFLLYEREEKEQLRAACLRRERRRLIFFSIAFLSLLLFCLLALPIAKEPSALPLFSRLLYVLYLGAWAYFLIPYLQKHPHIHPGRIRKTLLFLLLCGGFLSSLHYIFQEHLLFGASSLLFLLLSSGGLCLFYEKGLLSRNAFEKGLLITAALFMILLLIAFFLDLPAAGALS